MSRDEAASYTDLMPDGKAWQFSFDMDVKSVITSPSGGQRLEGHGLQTVSGIAWSGRGCIRRVEVSSDGGMTWRDAELQTPVLPKAFTRFVLPWTWRGEDAWLMSRATDDTGDVQPTRELLIAERGMKPGPDGFNHYNGIKGWHVLRDGRVSHA